MNNHPSSLIYVPLNRLIVSARNVRRTDRKADIEALSASIAAHGLLQNLTVAPAGADCFAVVAGARRLAALKALSKSGAIARDFPVPCHLIEEAGAAEASLAENVQRVAMNAMDEMEAFAALAQSGLSGEEIARRFGCTLRHVEQRLALAALSPRIKAAYRRAELTLEAARAFCIEPDHARQDAVLRTMTKPISHASSVRAALTKGRMRSGDRLVRFVGLDAYEQAGGTLTRDLFDPEAVFVNDPALISRLADERLSGLREGLLAAGWGWVQINPGGGPLTGCAQRLHPSRRAMNRKERKALAEIEGKIAELDAALEDAEEDDARWEERDQLAACRHQALEAALKWDPALIAHAGVSISIASDGRPAFAYGLVAKSDQVKLKRLLAERAPKEAAADADVDGGADAKLDVAPPSPAPWDDLPGPRLPKSLTLELTSTRARALRLKVSEAPDIALALAVYALARAALVVHPATGIGLEARAAALADHENLEHARVALYAILPGDADALLAWLLSQPRQTLLECLAVIVAGALDLAHEGVSFEDRRKQALADRLASATDLDMSRFWTPEAHFWARVPKALLLEALAAAPAFASFDEAERAARLKAHAKLKRDDLAQTVAQALANTAWLPDLLITPVAAGALCVTAEGEQEIAAA